MATVVVILLAITPLAVANAFQTQIGGVDALFSDKNAVEYGHSVYVALFNETLIETNVTMNFSAVASVTVERQFTSAVFKGGVLWFNDSILFDDVDSALPAFQFERCFNDTAVHAVAVGSPNPTTSATNTSSTYVESYQVMDPNGQTYITDLYLWNVTTGGSSIGPFVIMPPTVTWHRTYVTNTGACINDPTLNNTSGGGGCSGHAPYGEPGTMNQIPGETGAVPVNCMAHPMGPSIYFGAYNAVNVIRLGSPGSPYLNVTSAPTAHPNATTSSGDGESHHHNPGPAVSPHVHPTAKIDLYWGKRPCEPGSAGCTFFPARTFVIYDTTPNEGLHAHPTP
ncbi:MAG: hypothetical protein ACT4PT_02285 [Methanobacteriota archaeon]